MRTEQERPATLAVVAPRNHRGECKEKDRQAEHFGKPRQDRRKRLRSHQHAFFSAALVGPRDDDDQTGHRAHHDRIDEGLEQRNDSFTNRLVGCGSGVRDRRGADTSLV